MIRPCFIIPCYRHALTLSAVVDKLLPHNYPIIIVDDGNTNHDKETIFKLKDKSNLIDIVSYDINQGKGYAISKGLEKAQALHFTHAIQIDADGQHDTNDLDTIIELMIKYPTNTISGAPIYGDDVPKSRLYGRKITTFFVHVETLSRSIKDAMIGFRVYPVAKTLEIIKKYKVSKGMPFDIEILVRLYWAGVKTIFFDTKVIYPEKSISNFKAIDQLKISWVHTKLCTHMICTLPLRLFTHENIK